MALKTYIGARYAPKFMGKWNNATAYEPLSVVYWNNNSYVSKSNVPAGTPVTVEEPDGEVVTNSAYWILSSDWNAQVAEYQATVEQYRDDAVKQTAATNQYRKDTQNFFEVTMHSYNTEEGMKIDSTVKVGYTLVTCGKRTIGDGGGRYFKVVEETSSDAIAIAGGLWAKPFNITSPEEAYAKVNVNKASSGYYDVEYMTNGGRFITDSITLETETVQFNLDVPDNANNIQLIMPLKPHNQSEQTFILFNGGGNIATMNIEAQDVVLRVKFDAGKITVSNSRMNYLTPSDKEEISTKITNLENKNKSQDLQINAKVNKDTFNTYKDGYNDEHGVIYYSGYAVGAAYRIALSDRHFQVVSVNKVNFPSPKPSVASLHLELTASTGFYSGYIIIPAQSEGFNLLESKKLIVKMGSGALNSVTIDCSTQQTIGYFGIVRKINEQENYYAFTVFNASGDFAYDDDITNLRSQLMNLIDQKVSQSVYDEFVNATNGTLDTKVAQTDFNNYKTNNDKAVAGKLNQSTYNSNRITDSNRVTKVENATDCMIFTEVSGTTGDSGKGVYELDYRTVLDVGVKNIGVILKTETLSLTGYEFNIPFNCPATDGVHQMQTVTVHIPQKTGLPSAGISGIVRVTMQRSDGGQFAARAFKISLSEEPIEFRVTFMPNVEPTESIALFTSNALS